jgi:hypothetical protein
MPTLTELAKEAILKYPKESNSGIAEAVGCSLRSAERARKELKDAGKLSPKKEEKGNR